MFKKMTIKMRIVIWFALAIFLIEAIMLSLTFAISKSVFNTDIQTQLVNQVDTNAEEIEFYNSLSGQEVEIGDQLISYNDGFLEIDDDFCDYINGIYTSLVDENNNLLYGECPVNLGPDQAFTYTQVDSVKHQGDRFYIYERPLHGGDLEGLWLRGVASQREGTNLLYTIMRFVMLLLPILAILTITGGYALTRRSFAPIQNIARAAEEIGDGDDLSKRIDLGPGNDEIHKLAATFNNMFDRLEQSFQRERQFTSDASHELRTPTAVILAQCEYSLELSETEEDYREALHVIQEQGNKMNRLIAQLLFFTRLEQGTEPLHAEPTDLSELTEMICEEQAMIRSSQIALEQEIQPDIWADVDRGLFSRLLTNLISNAYKYGKDGGHTLVSLMKEGQDIVLKVSDDGIGISEENLDKIWTRFYQVDASRTASSESEQMEGEGGVGLGLTMVKEIVHLHHGSIDVESRLGEGTIFTVRLPEAREEKPGES